MKYERLRKLTDHHMQLPFPEHPDSEELAEWILDLAELDGQYLGIATSFLNQRKLYPLDFSDYNKKKNKLCSISVFSENDKIIFDFCVCYIDSIYSLLALYWTKNKFMPCNSLILNM